MEGEEECKDSRVSAEDNRMLTFELEAAEALAGMARCSPVREKEQLSSQPIVAEAGVVSSHPSQADKEARKLRRILANRESARQTIRRRQVMHLELTEKATDLSAENMHLKKEKDLALNKYNSLKEKNKFLKAELVKWKEAEPAGDMQEEPRASRAEISCSATAPTPIFLCDQPSLVPLFWPSIVPSDVFNMQCASHSDNSSASQFLVPIWDKQCPNQGQKCSMGINKPGTPLFVLRVPWLLPFLPRTNTHESCSGNSDRQNKTSLIQHCHMCLPSANLVHEGNHKMSSNQNTSAEAFNSARTVSVSNVLPPGGGKQYTRPHLKAAVPDVNTGSSVPEHKAHGFLKKYHRPFIPPSRKSGDVVAATEARRKRKELMNLKNIHFHNAHT